MGEKSEGRGADSENMGPATQELKDILKPRGRAARLAKLATKHKCPPKITKELTKVTPWKIESILTQLPRKGPKKKKPKMFPSGREKGAKLCSRQEMIMEGPFPLEKRMAELAGHAYYLWGDAKYLAYKAEGTSVEVPAQIIMRFAKQAEGSAKRLAAANHIPMSNNMDNAFMMSLGRT